MGLYGAGVCESVLWGRGVRLVNCDLAPMFSGDVPEDAPGWRRDLTAAIRRSGGPASDAGNHMIGFAESSRSTGERGMTPGVMVCLQGVQDQCS